MIAVSYQGTTAEAFDFITSTSLVTYDSLLRYDTITILAELGAYCNTITEWHFEISVFGKALASIRTRGWTAVRFEDISTRHVLGRSRA